MSSAKWFQFLSACDLAAAIRKGELNAEQVTDACLEQIEQINIKINAVVQVAPAAARQRARKLDQLAAKGKWQGPLHGVPITIKDSFDTAGIVSTGGTLGRKDFIPQKNATVVQRLLDSGAVLLGKTNTPELTLGGETENLIYGLTRNPYDFSCSPGGSSGGSVSAVASGMSFLELGSDTGGSIREPAHFCGVVGIKPTSGSTSRTGHIIPWGTGVLDSLTQVGPIARYVEDLELGLSIISGPDGVDPSVIPIQLLSSSKILKRKLRIAFYTDNGVAPVCHDIERVVTATAEMLREQGHTVEQAVLPGIKQLSQKLIALRDAATGKLVKRLLDQNGTTRPGPVLSAYLSNGAIDQDKTLDPGLLETIDWLRSRALEFMSNYDAILCPASCYLARPIGESLNDDYSQWSHVTVHNLLGWPGLVVRAGTGIEQKLPVGVQIITAPWQEHIALALGKVIEKQMGGFSPPKF